MLPFSLRYTCHATCFIRICRRLPAAAAIHTALCHRLRQQYYVDVDFQLFAAAIVISMPPLLRDAITLERKGTPVQNKAAGAGLQR